MVTFGDKVTKIQKYYIIFVYILQGKMGKTEKTGKEITQLKWPKYQKPKDESMGWPKQKSVLSSPAKLEYFHDLDLNLQVCIVRSNCKFLRS